MDGIVSLTARQKALLHVAKAQLRLSEEEYRALLHGAAGVESSRDLDSTGFERVLARLEALGFTVRRRYPKGRATQPDPSALVTPAQQKRIRDLYAAIAWDEPRQRGFNRRVCGKPWPQTRSDANKIVEALKAMMARGYSVRKPRPPKAGGGHGGA